MGGLILRGRLLPASLLTAVAGHWVANLLFDRDEYVGIGSEVVGRLHLPALIQTGVGLVIIGALTAWGRRRPTADRPQHLAGLERRRLVGILVGMQILFFVAMETSERIAIEAFSAVPTGVEPLGVGFVSELLVAIGSAVLISFLGEAAARIVSNVVSHRTTRSVRSQGRLSLGAYLPRRQVLIGAGGVRAPPPAF